MCSSAPIPTKSPYILFSLCAIWLLPHRCLHQQLSLTMFWFNTFSLYFPQSISIAFCLSQPNTLQLACLLKAKESIMFSSDRTVNELPLVLNYRISQLHIQKLDVVCAIHRNHINTQCGQNVLLVGRAEFKQNFALTQLLNAVWKIEYYINEQTKFFGLFSISHKGT